MAEDKERFRRAMDFMKMLGVSHSVVAPLLRRLVKLYNNEWSLIEEENYRALADSYFEQMEQQETTGSQRVTRNMTRRVTSTFGSSQPFEQKGGKVAVSKKAQVVAPEYSSIMEKEQESITCNKIKSRMEIDHGTNSGSTKGEASSIGLCETITAADTITLGTQVECMRYEERAKGHDTRNSVENMATKRPRKEGSKSPSNGRLVDRSPGLPAKSSFVVKQEPVELALPSSPERVQSDNKGMELVPVKKEPREIAALITSHKEEQSCKRDEDALSAIAMVYGYASDEENGETQGELDMVMCNDSGGIFSNAKEEEHMPESSNRQAHHTHERSLTLVVKEESVSCSPYLQHSRSMVAVQNKALAGERRLVVVKQEPDIGPLCLNIKPCEESTKDLGMPWVGHCNLKDRFAIVSQHSQQETRGETEPYMHSVDDVSRGQEQVLIPVLNELTKESIPVSFYYVPRNITFQNAYMNFSLARIGEEDCCANCVGDCLKRYPPCFCARETGGEFAYSPEGLLRKSFLREAISDRRSLETSSRMYFCKVGECPLEQKTKDECCKGHLMRKFIKECWIKCGCNMHCGNRVVQKGICHKLQVFFTSEKKGWGVRTLEDLCGGTFVCEYVGEVLTNSELDTRNVARKGHLEHYPVLLDADWSSEKILRDDELLCLDATNFGNVARFINHRCEDANLVDIPVEIESPDHHYYHIAFFTTRFVKAFEELTWDYCIDFDDLDHPVKAFQCVCESRYCRGRQYEG